MQKVLEGLKVEVLPEQELQTCDLIAEHAEVEGILSINSTNLLNSN